MNQEIFLEDGMIIVSQTNEKGIIQYANEDFCVLSGYSIDELIGKPHNIVRDSDMPKAAFNNLWKTIKEGKVWHGIVKNRTKKGNFYWVNATVYPSKSSENLLRYISVRVKPTKNEVEDAMKLYSTLK